MDAAAVLVNHYPACAGHVVTQHHASSCLLGTRYLYAWATSSADPERDGDTQAALLAPAARVDAIDRVGDQAVVIVRWDG